MAAGEVQRGGKGFLVSSFPAHLLLGIEVSRIEVTWLGSERPEGLPANPSFLYLGGADGTAVLLETGRQRIYRVSSETVVISTLGRD
jgi:hypothetical protein